MLAPTDTGELRRYEQGLPEHTFVVPPLSRVTLDCQNSTINTSGPGHNAYMKESAHIVVANCFIIADIFGDDTPPVQLAPESLDGTVPLQTLFGILYAPKSEYTMYTTTLFSKCKARTQPAWPCPPLRSRCLHAAAPARPACPSHVHRTPGTPLHCHLAASERSTQLAWTPAQL